MATIKDFEELEIWQLSRKLYRETCRILKGKKSDDFLCSHIKRTAVSIVSNIAEGFERGSQKEFIRFLIISLGSCGEYRTQLYLLLDTEIISQNEFDLLHSLIRELTAKISKFTSYLRNYKPSPNRQTG